MSPKVTANHKEQRRKEIMHAAVEVFKRKGFEPVTMKDIVEESGMSRGGVYMYFSSTEEIFRAILDEMEASEEQQLARLFEQGLNMWGVVDKLLEEQEHQIERVAEGLTPAVFEYFFTGWREKNRDAYMVERYKRAIRQWAPFLEAAVERGELQPRMPVESMFK
ncbi:TetR family transcriptional regulator, partial [Aneurinibacillus tyrosinisolvens]|uniref:TetR family transcriptional regulator n=1 Tax=Aneurinibacillus tyrosinisolvens TaxID=1443435 RepID=UPI00063F6B1C